MPLNMKKKFLYDFFSLWQQSYIVGPFLIIFPNFISFIYEKSSILCFTIEIMSFRMCCVYLIFNLIACAFNWFMQIAFRKSEDVLIFIYFLFLDKESL